MYSGAHPEEGPGALKGISSAAAIWMGMAHGPGLSIFMAFTAAVCLMMLNRRSLGDRSYLSLQSLFQILLKYPPPHPYPTPPVASLPHISAAPPWPNLA